MMKLNRLALYAFLVSACGPGPSGDALVTIEQVGVVVGDTADGGFTSFPFVSAALSDGRRVAIQPNTIEATPIVILDAAGRVVDTLALPGEGPGQVTGARQILRGIGDSILVFGSFKVSVFTPDLRFARSFPIPVHGVLSAVQLTNGDLALSNSMFGAPEPVVVVSALDGSRKWGIPGGPRGADGRPPLENRVLASGSNGTLWVAKSLGRLEFFHFASDGALIDSIIPARSWFAPYERFEMPTRTLPSSPSLSGFWVDSQDRAWLIGQAIDPDWATAEGEDRPGEGGTSYFIAKRASDVRDGIVDVLDLRSGDLVSSLRTDSLLGLVIEPWMLERPRTDADGWVQLDLYRVSGRF